jgi:hypothetical protein
MGERKAYEREKEKWESEYLRNGKKEDENRRKRSQ